jgi:tRNA-dihydrouridine synthase 1
MASETGGRQGGLGEGAQSNGVAQADRIRRKLHGRAFYESIGSPKLVLAPMVEQSEFVRFFTPRFLLHFGLVS